MIKCIYCTKEKEEHEFSLEHIFPTALGGKVLPDAVFKTRSVCRECNSRFGLYIDGAFLKSFFPRSYRPDGNAYIIPNIYKILK